MPEFIPTEAQEGLAVVQWLRLQDLQFTHTPNETGSSPEARRRAIRMKQQGTSPGFPDYTILIPPARSVTGAGFLLFIELKRRKGGRLSPAQQEWLNAINALEVQPVAAYVAHGADMLINIVGKHMKRS